MVRSVTFRLKSNINIVKNFYIFDPNHGCFITREKFLSYIKYIHKGKFYRKYFLLYDNNHKPKNIREYQIKQNKENCSTRITFVCNQEPFLYKTICGSCGALVKTYKEYSKCTVCGSEWYKNIIIKSSNYKDSNKYYVLEVDKFDVSGNWVLDKNEEKICWNCKFFAEYLDHCLVGLCVNPESKMFLEYSKNFHNIGLGSKKEDFPCFCIGKQIMRAEEMQDSFENFIRDIEHLEEFKKYFLSVINKKRNC